MKLGDFFALLIPQSIRPASTSLMKYQVLDSPSVELSESDKFVSTDYIDKFIALRSWRYSARLMAVRMNQYLMFLTTILCSLFLD